MAKDIFVLIWGACVGSFLNVCIYRIPRRMSVVFGPSHCTHCTKELKVQDLLPVLSYVLLKGRCRHCGTVFSIRYPAVELLTAAFFFAVYRHWGLGWQTISMWVFFSALVVVSFVDFDTLLIPDRVLITAVALGAPALWLTSKERLLDGVAGFFGAGLIMLAISLAARGGMGGGDVKLSAAIGFFIGWPDVLVVLFLSFMIGALAGAVLLALGKKKRKDAVPFGPFLAMGGVAGAFWGDRLVQWYLSLL
ncbi:MAG: peptidase A24 [Peptococcaceae bacterium BICA1-7]|nr:MAG: peptidase A24 [Peptococcaceae bacterium BICA1-7]HBV97066.1 prepilin peptidase [Desulfotomaculum sp.]